MLAKSNAAIWTAAPLAKSSAAIWAAALLHRHAAENAERKEEDGHTNSSACEIILQYLMREVKMGMVEKMDMTREGTGETKSY